MARRRSATLVDDVIARETLMRTEFYNDFLARDGLHHGLNMFIFDGDRDQRYPVDGGVFDVPPNVDQVVVPIHAEVPVHAAKAFAVTIEKPGGVVVSEREHVVAIGKAG